jgi:membrane protease subunit (stomatin/prohibitin family)
MGLNVGNAVGDQFGGITKVLNTSSGDRKECPQCHMAVTENNRFCSNCGFDTQKKESEKGNLIKCSKCGVSYPVNSKFCPECGDKYNPCPNCEADMAEGATACSSCGYELPEPCPKCKAPLTVKNLKFCPECGTSLVKKCPKCDFVINGSPKFCPDCGEKLS